MKKKTEPLPLLPMMPSLAQALLDATVKPEPVKPPVDKTLCTTCHKNPRHVNRTGHVMYRCKECINVYRKQYYHDNKRS